MIAKQYGIILVTVLIFLFIFSLLAITGLTSSLLQIKMTHNLADYQQHMQTVEAGLAAGEKLVFNKSDSPCIMLEPLADDLAQPWSVGKSCTLSYNGQLVHYTIQRLFANACLVVGTAANKQAVLEQGDIFQITAWLEQLNKPVVVLQTTYAQALAASCSNPANEIRPGRLSWREIY